MVNKILLAILLGVVLRFLGTLGIKHYLKKSSSEEELRQYKGLHVSVITYMFGTLFKYGGWLFLGAHLVKEYLLS